MFAVWWCLRSPVSSLCSRRALISIRNQLVSLLSFWADFLKHCKLLEISPVLRILIISLCSSSEPLSLMSLKAVCNHCLMKGDLMDCVYASFVETPAGVPHDPSSLRFMGISVSTDVSQDWKIELWRLARPPCMNWRQNTSFCNRDEWSSVSPFVYYIAFFFRWASPWWSVLELECSIMLITCWGCPVACLSVSWSQPTLHLRHPPYPYSLCPVQFQMA